LSSTRPGGTASGSWWGYPPNNMWVSSSIGRRVWPTSRRWSARRSGSAPVTRRCCATPSATRSRRRWRAGWAAKRSSATSSGCAGVFVFSWTDEWYRHRHSVEDWSFGLTRADRSPKPALEAVREAFAEVPFSANLPWPRISVVVCTYNGARTIRDCLDGLEQLAYPDYEVIVVDDGSTDSTAAIACQYDYRLIRTENRGLSNARNTGLKAATGEIV